MPEREPVHYRASYIDIHHRRNLVPSAPRWPVEYIGTRPINVVAAPLNRTTRRQRLAAWRTEHYAADQAIRVGLILGAILGMLASAAVALFLVVELLAGTIAPLVGGLAFLAIAAALLTVAFRAPSRRGHSGYGFHYSKCDH